MTNDALARLSAATQALAVAKTMDEIKQIRDIAVAAQTYAKAAKLGLDAQNHAAEIKLSAERKAGELLKQLGSNPVGRPTGNYSKLEQFSEYRQVLVASAIAPVTAHRWQQIAELPEHVFQAHVAERQEAREELTTSGLLRVVQERKRQEMVQEKRTQPWPQAQYRVFYADPPWQYGDSGLDEYGHAERHYPTLSLAELVSLGSKVRELASTDAVLFLWATSPMLEVAFQVIRAWGFFYKTSFVWDKVKHNFGHYNSVRHELLLVCTRGSCQPDVSTLFDSVQTIERGEHSAKPKEFREMIDTLYTWGGRIELFARQSTPGWDAWGNELS